MKKVYIENSRVRDFENLVSEISDCREGVVMDSYTGVLNNGVEFVAIDTFETSWTSGLTIYTGSSKELAAIWDNFTAKYDAEFGEEV